LSSDFNTSNTTGSTNEEGTYYPSGEPGSTRLVEGFVLLNLYLYA